MELEYHVAYLHCGHLLQLAQAATLSIVYDQPLVLLARNNV